MTAGPYNTQTTAGEIVKDLKAQIAGKVVLTTGVSPGGLGASFVDTIAKAQPSLLILAGRTPSKIQATADAINQAEPAVQTRILQLDLESLQKVREAAETVMGWTDVPAIDVLVNNAGVMACDYAKTVDGIERQLAANHVGHFLFTNLIMSKILASLRSPRIVSVSSDGHRLSAMRWPDPHFEDGKLYNKWRGYGQAKTANVLFGVALAEKLGKKGLTSVSLHPGVITSTNLSNSLAGRHEFQDMRVIERELGNAEGWATDFSLKSMERGTATHVYASFHPDLISHNGAYLTDSHIADPYVDSVKPHATSKVEADKLWALSEELVGKSFFY